jgi:hypothetical protein
MSSSRRRVKQTAEYGDKPEDLQAAAAEQLTEERIAAVLEKHGKGPSMKAVWIRLMAHALRHERRLKETYKQYYDHYYD